MILRKAGLLVLILGFGGLVETAWALKTSGVLTFGGPAGCRVLSGRFHGPSFAFESEQSVAVPASTSLDVQNAFGAVRVGLGEPGTVKVKLKKVVFRPDEPQARAFAERVRLESSLVGSNLRLATNRESLELGDGREVGFETHLEVLVPPGTALTVKNSHGRVEARDLAGADVTASFEEVVLERVAGNVNMSAAHGAASVTGVGGTLTVTQRHGNLTIGDVAGGTTVETSHGDLAVERVGPLTVEIAHGQARIRAVKGDLDVRGRHAGVDVEDVTGKAVVETTYRDVRLARTGGDARVKAQHGGVQAEDVGGGLVVEASYDAVRVDRVGGPLEARVEHGGLRAAAVLKGVRASASGDDVVLDSVSGPVEVRVERAGVRYVPAGALTFPVSIATTHGGIEVEVPPASRFQLEAESRRGEVDVDVPGLVLSPSADHPRGETRVTGTLGGGGSLLRLQAEHGDVRVRAGLAAAEAGVAPSPVPTRPGAAVTPATAAPGR